MEYHRFTMEPFASQETGTPLHREIRRREQVRRSEPLPGSVYRQTALCALIVALLIVLELFVFRTEAEAIPVSAPAEEAASEILTSEAGEDGEEEDALGRLQFVNGRVYSVFSSDASWVLPFAPTETETMEDGRLLCLRTDASTSVRAAAAGQVQAIEDDAQYGLTVRIYHGKDRASVYCGFESISVEVGQPLLAGDTIGHVAADGALYLAATENGEPVTVLDCFDADPLTVT